MNIKLRNLGKCNSLQTRIDERTTLKATVKMEAPLIILTSSTNLYSSSRACNLPSFDSDDGFTSPSNLQYKSRPSITRPSDSHQFCIPNLTVSSTSMGNIHKANSFNDIKKHKSGSRISVPLEHPRYVKSRPSVTSENVITGMKPCDNGKGWIRRESSQMPRFCNGPSNTFSSTDNKKQRKRAKGLTLKEIKQLALYEKVGDTYGHIVAGNVGVSLTPYGFPVLQESPRDLTDESKFHTFRYDTKSFNLIQNDRPHHQYMSPTASTLPSECQTPVIEVTITYDEMRMIRLSSLKMKGIKDKRRVIITADIASHLRRKRVIGPLVSVDGNCEYNKDVVFFRAQESHFELSQIKVCV